MAKRIKDKFSGKNICIGAVINYTLLAVFTTLIMPLMYIILFTQFLNFMYINWLVAAILLFSWLVTVVFIFKKKAKIITKILLVLLSLGSVLLLFIYNMTFNLVDKFNSTASYSETEMSIIVAKDSPIKKLSQLTEVQAPLNSDIKNIKVLLNKVETEEGIHLNQVDTASYQTAYDAIIANHSKAMVLNSAYGSLLELKDTSYATQIRTLYTYKINKKLALNQQPKLNVFNIYVSGIDTYGPISAVSRSDVNIIITVNMDTHKILLTTTPRDSYVKIPGAGEDQYDKLTHAGVYGVDISMKTLENLYNINIDYYARINFTSFLNLIDVIGGVQVDNPRPFSAGGYKYPAGKIDLDSKSALRFVRERHALAGGDFDRGKNQELVIAALIQKLASPQSLTKLSNIVTALQDSVNTNISFESIMQIANTQLSSGGQFTVSSQDVIGTGSVGKLPSHAMPGSSLYMLSLDPNSLNSAKTAINQVMEGK